MMVYRYDDSRLLVCLQIDHSRVAGLLAAHWGNDVFAEPQPYAPMVLAAQEHDNGWWEWEVKPTTNAEGFPLDYITGGGLPRPIWVLGYANGIRRVAERDPYAGLIACMHAIGLCNRGYGLLAYMPDRMVDPSVQEFVREQEALRAQLLDELRRSDEYREFATDERIWTNFKLMEIFDLFAQFICNRYPFNSGERRNGPSPTLADVPVPVAPGRDEVPLTVDVQDETRAIVRPFPFDVDPLVVSFPGRLMPNRPYRDQEDFLRHYYKAERITVTYSLHAA
jgi:hypothetical protein